MLGVSLKDESESYPSHNLCKRLLFFFLTNNNLSVYKIIQ